MIRTVTIFAGSSPYATSAQAYGMQWAAALGARLVIAGIWDESDRSLAEAGEDPVAVEEQALHALAKKAGARGIDYRTSERGDGLTRGLVEESRETDLLVLGIPTRHQARHNDVAARLFSREKPVLRRAESSVLVVTTPLQPVREILVLYQGGMQDKSAVRMAGFLAERFGAGLHVLSVQRDTVQAVELTSSAEQYLGGFEIDRISSLPETGAPHPEARILERAEELACGLIVLGHAQHGLLRHAGDAHTAECVALATGIPVLLVH
jgi:nucleotide-binding universal stress UspA family protein